MNRPRKDGEGQSHVVRGVEVHGALCKEQRCGLIVRKKAGTWRGVYLGKKEGVSIA